MTPQGIWRHLSPFLWMDREVVMLGYLLTSGITIWELHSLGTISLSIIHPGAIQRRCHHLQVAHLSIGHTHPSGCLQPSEEDLHATRVLTAILPCPLTHIICTHEGWFCIPQGACTGVIIG